MDFHNWAIVVKMYKFGYYVLPEGKAVLLKIISSSNKFRYSTNDYKNSSGIDPHLITLYKSDDLFSMNPPFNVSSGLNHTILAQNLKMRSP